LLFALVAGAVAWRAQYVAHAAGSDHVILQRAAKVFLAGGDPYQIGAANQLPTVWWRFYYPLPSIVLGLPFVWLPPEQTAIAFVVCSSFLLGWCLTRDGFERVSLVLSVPFLAAAQFAQSSPLILALALVPATRALAILKPNIGLAIFAWRPAWRNVLIAAALFAVPIAFWPKWPEHWLISVRSSPAHHAPALTGIGAIALLSALRWRRPEGRLLFVMTIVPHGLFFYDELPLWLVAETRREAMVLTAFSWAGWLAWNIASPGPNVVDSATWAVASLYMPALVMVLRRPNEGALPSWVEHAVAWLPAWIRGRAPNGSEVSSGGRNAPFAVDQLP
jgi:hypothetical protein